MAPNGSACLRKSSTAINVRNVLKKGPWTVSEDSILVEYVKKHGEGNWNAVQRNSGLMRCGKSCRLRWANHLRPNLKKGAFSAEEERLIAELHAKLGNKWARMAAQLPGRTDNEIKNYWNTRFKRRQRAGLPIYPQELSQENQHLNSSLSSLLVLSSNPSNLNSSLCFLDTLESPSTINPLHNPNTSSYTNQELKLFRDNNGGLALSLAASNSSFSASSTMGTQHFFDQTLASLPIPSLLQYNSLNIGFNSCNDMGIIELPSIQPSTAAAAAAAAATPSPSEDYEVEMKFSRGKKSGLLEDLLGESMALNCSEKSEVDSFMIKGNDELKSTWDFSMLEGGEAASNLNEKSDLSFGHGSVTATIENNNEGTEKKAEVDGMNCEDDDILNLLDNFPLAVPIPDWNESNPCDCESSNLTNGGIENQHKYSTYNPVANSTEAADEERNFGQCFWNNMPSIY